MTFEMAAIEQVQPVEHYRAVCPECPWQGHIVHDLDEACRERDAHKLSHVAARAREGKQ